MVSVNQLTMSRDDNLIKPYCVNNNDIESCVCEFCAKGEYKFKCIAHNENLVNKRTNGKVFTNTFIDNKGGIVCECPQGCVIDIGIAELNKHYIRHEFGKGYVCNEHGTRICNRSYVHVVEKTNVIENGYIANGCLNGCHFTLEYPPLNNLPNSVVLCCATFDVLAEDCVKTNKNCPTCSNHKYVFKCKDHYLPKHYLCYGHHKVDRLNTLFTTFGSYVANRCSEEHLMDYSSDNLRCCHGELATQCESKYEVMGNVFSEIYEKITDKDTKDKMIKFLLNWNNQYGTYSGFPKSDKFKHWINLYDRLCKYINIDVSKFCDTKYYYHSEEIYRLIQIGQDLSMEQKLNLYCNVKCETIQVGDKKFVKENIYNLEFLKSGSVFRLKDHCYDGNKNDNNKMYGLEIYSMEFLKQIKEIRRKAFGILEDDVDIMAIPMAYKDYGLFWKPVRI